MEKIEPKTTLYLDAINIASVNIVRKHKILKIIKKHWPNKQLFGFTTSKEFDEYFPSTSHIHRGDGYSTFDKALHSDHVRHFILAIGHSVYYNADSNFFEVKDDEVFIKTYIVITDKNGSKRIKFVNSEEETNEYLKELGITDKLLKIDYDI